MDTDRIRHSQEFLVINGVEGEKKLLDLESLLSIHPPEAVANLIDQLIAENKAKLRRHLRRDKKDPRIDQLVARLFRLKMSKSTLLNAIPTAQDAA